MKAWEWMRSDPDIGQCAATSHPYRCIRNADGHFVHWSYNFNREGKTIHVIWTDKP